MYAISTTPGPWSVNQAGIKVTCIQLYLATCVSIVTTESVGYELNTREWPVVHFRFFGRLQPDERERYLLDADDLIRVDKPYVCIYDGREMLTPDSDFIRKQADWIRINRELVTRLNRGTAFITSSAMITGLVRAIFYFQPFPAPYAFFRTLPDAVSFVQECFARPASALPPKVTEP
ncbi:MAG TPA: hypothetical protein VFN67_32960 [Polyangiales bacterium]|nr:hypothetical protein [Polyangiales bacterium]